MTWPEPRPGLVIRYAHLWREEAEAGRDEGVKDRPCAVLLAARTVQGDTIVYALPITHAEPRSAADGVEIPAVTKRRLGLDGERSWIVITEVNLFPWPGPDLRPLPGQGLASCAYGMLPPRLFAEVRDRFLARARARRAQLVKRTE